MRILVTGRKGQVARSLVERAAGSEHEIVTLARPELDLEGDTQAILDAVTSASPEAIVSAAAYTAVDKAETDTHRAFQVNAFGARAIASAAARLGVPLVHLSTDYVFDGSKDTPYAERDPTGPTGAYGASKLAGEQAVLQMHPNSVVLRTAWVYSPSGSNFVKTMLRVAQSRDEVRVVGDQFGNPTSASDIADAVLAIITKLVRRGEPELRGVFHMSGCGDTSWAGFAREILDISAEVGGPTAEVVPITTEEYPTPAKRPANSRLDCSKLERLHGRRLPHWRTSLPPVVRAIIAQMKDEEQR